ncbi:diacylglycerol kinase family lipid kinase [Lactobacillus sp. YT155]|uniref:diacylglycerol/lipid kinase family protein n=1 Tax=Lactobacillus sp. YT155 TaxID=3060955 RepID=UPI00265FA91B|nr:diacylglycerol kinase family protein [Lactobacillus sp. YT155]MDO1605293.1 diacylglycerol kinase family lipid kinase [Lactobacillus sp. YT155]
MKYKNLHIILNEHASSGRAKKRGFKFLELLKQRNIEYTYAVTKKPNDGVRLGKEFAESKQAESTLLVVIGGDGTLNECLNGIRSSSNPTTPLSYIPSGSGNDFARGLKVEHQLNQIIDGLESDLPTTNVDIGKFIDNENNYSRFFVNNIGIGFDAAIVVASNKSASKKFFNTIHLGKLIYVSQLVKVFFQQKAFDLQVESFENKKDFIFKKVFLVTTTNHPFFGGGIPIVPTANPFDHQLDLIVVEKMSFLSIIGLFIKLLTNGSHMNDDRVHHLTSNNMLLQTDQPEYKQMDGEGFEKTAINLTFNVDQHPFVLINK